VMVSTLDRWNYRDEAYRTTNGGASWTAVSPTSVRDSSLSPYLNWGEAAAAFGHWIGDLEIDPFDSNHVVYVTGATIWASNDVTGADTGQTTHWTVGAAGLEETAVTDLVSPPSGASLISALGDIAGFRHDDLGVSPRGGMWSNPRFTSTSSIDFAAADPNLVVRVGSGGAQRGAYSLDGAATWSPFAGAPTGEAGWIAVSADGRTFVWAPDQRPPSYSRDRGTTWTPCSGVSSYVRVVADRVNAQRFYAIDSASGSVYASADGGATFAARTVVASGSSSLRSTPGQEGDVWLAAGAGLYRSVDGGAVFTRMATVQSADGIGFGAAAPGKTNPALYLGGRVDSLTGVFRSDDAGLTWVRINDDQHQYGGAGRIISGDARLYGRVYLGTNGRGLLYADPAR
jgi:hypothetical protein